MDEELPVITMPASGIYIRGVRASADMAQLSYAHTFGWLVWIYSLIDQGKGPLTGGGPHGHGDHTELLYFPREYSPGGSERILGVAGGEQV